MEQANIQEEEKNNGRTKQDQSPPPPHPPPPLPPPPPPHPPPIQNIINIQQPELSFWKKLSDPMVIFQMIIALGTIGSVITYIVISSNQIRLTREAIRKSDSATKEAIMRSDIANSHTLKALEYTSFADSIAKVSLDSSIGANQMNQRLAIRDILARDMNTKMELRGYLAIKEFKLLAFNSNNKILYKILATNTGKTPIYEISALCAFKGAGSGVFDSDWDVFKDYNLRKIFSFKDIKGNGIDFTMTNSIDVPISQWDSISIYKGYASFFIYGIIFYRDIFKQKHSLRYCRYFDPSTRI